MKIGYARVSTESQKLDLQIDALQKAGCEKIYSEKISGINPYKHELESLLQYARPEDTLIIWKLDRLGRSIKDLIEYSERFSNMNINFISLTENINTSSPTGKMFFHMMAVFSEFERDIKRERTKKGIEAARKRGIIGGRPSVLTKEQKEAVTRELQNNIPVKTIAQNFKVSVPTIYRIRRRLFCSSKY